jgi:hypothetical protein
MFGFVGVIGVGAVGGLAIHELMNGQRCRTVALPGVS